MTAETRRGRLETPWRNQNSSGQPAKTMKVGRLKVARAQMAPIEMMLDQSTPGLLPFGMIVSTRRMEVKASSRLLARGRVAYTNMRWLEPRRRSGSLGGI